MPRKRDTDSRKARKPLGSVMKKMDAPPRPGFSRRWFNDTGNRLQAAEDAGYEFVRDPAEEEEEGRGRQRSMVVGTKEDGSPLHAYLMEIRKDWYDEDQAAKQEQIDELEAAINKGATQGDRHPNDQGSYYVPANHVGITHGSKS